MKTNRNLLYLCLVSLLIIQACAASSAITSSFQSSDQQDICDNASVYDFLDLDNTDVQLWDQEEGLYTLNHQEKSDLLESYGSKSDTFCDREVSEETQILLEEVQALEDNGDSEKASQKLQEYIHKLEQGIGSKINTNKLAKINLYSKESTFKYIRDMLSIAGIAQLLGENDLYDEAMSNATDTFEDYGNETIEKVSDFKDALEIAAQAQILGLEELAELAMDKAMDLAEKLVDETFTNFDICSATEKDVNKLFRMVALSNIFHLKDYRDKLDEAKDLAKQWKEIQEKRENGETVPECDLNFIEIDADFGNPYMHVSGSIFTCDGSNWEIEISLDGTLDGSIFTGQGSLTFSLEDGKSIGNIIPVTGTAKFGEDVLEYQDPLSFKFYLLGDGKSQIMLSSTGQGTMKTPIGPITFAILPTTESEIIPIIQKDCGN